MPKPIAFAALGPSSVPLYVVTFSPPTSFSPERFMSLLMSGIAGMPLVALKSDVGDGTPSDLRFTVRYLGEKLGFTQFLSPMLMMPALISLPCVLAVTSPLNAAGELTTSPSPALSAGSSFGAAEHVTFVWYPDVLPILSCAALRRFVTSSPLEAFESDFFADEHAVRATLASAAVMTLRRVGMWEVMSSPVRRGS